MSPFGVLVEKCGRLGMAAAVCPLQNHLAFLWRKPLAWERARDSARFFFSSKANDTPNSAKGRGCFGSVARGSQSVTGFRSTPMPSNSTSTTSPVERGPTPAGVPVIITSPGSNVITLEA